jgi:hypothetical protein
VTQCGFFGTPLGLGLATATTSAPFDFERRMRFPAASSVACGPHTRASTSGSAIRRAPGKVPAATVEVE